jgi:polar amino acid transport system substrate-binding protein
MTITEQRSQDMCISIPYLYNKQVAVVKTEDLSNYTDKASFKNAVIGVEAGSAGESVVTGK